MHNSRDDTPSSSTDDSAGKPQWLYVVEVNDSHGVRRSPHHPQLKLARTQSLPGPKLEERLSRKGVYTRGDYVSLRHDLMPLPEAIGGRDNPAVVPADKPALEQAFRALRTNLEAAGFTVNRRNTSVYRLYVCGLEKGCISRGRDASSGDLYVGQTSQTVDERLYEHLHGHTSSGNERYRSNKYVRNHFLALQPHLIPSTFPEILFCNEHALRAESLLRLWLERDGYTVEGATDRYDTMKRSAAGSGFEDVLRALPTWPNQPNASDRRRQSKR